MDFVSTTDPGRPAGADSVAGQVVPIKNNPPVANSIGSVDSIEEPVSSGNTSASDNGSGRLASKTDAPNSALGPPRDEELYAGLTAATWTKIGIITALMSALFWPNLHRLWLKTNPFTGEANWGHAICVPIIGLYYLYVNREKLLHPPELQPFRPHTLALAMWVLFAFAVASPLFYVKELANDYLMYSAIAVAAILAVSFLYCWSRSQSPLVLKAERSSAQWFGGYIVVFGVAFYGYWIYPGQNDFFKDFGMVITLFGVVLALTDWKVMQTAWFPIAFLVCGIPWPGLIYSKIALPLQQLAANVAVWTLQITGVESSSNGTKIFISGYNGVVRTLNVAEACAGLRSLMTFVSVGAAVAFLSHRPLWQKITITVSAIPIAIFCNVMRISGQGLLDHYVSQQLSENFAHQFVGMIMLIPAFLLILLIGWMLDQIFLEEVDRKRIAVTKVIRRNTAGPVIALPATPRPVRVSTIAGANSRPAAQMSAATVARSLAAVKASAGNKPAGSAAPVTPPPSARLASGKPRSAGAAPTQNIPAQNLPRPKNGSGQNGSAANGSAQNGPTQNNPMRIGPGQNGGNSQNGGNPANGAASRNGGASENGGVMQSGGTNRNRGPQKIAPAQKHASAQTVGSVTPKPPAPQPPANAPQSRPEVP